MLRFFISVDFYNKNLNSDIGSSRPIHFHAYKLTNKQINNISLFLVTKLSQRRTIMQKFAFRAVSFNFWMLGLKRYTFLENPIIVCAAYTNSCYTIFAQFTLIEVSESW